MIDVLLIETSGPKSWLSSPLLASAHPAQTTRFFLSGGTIADLIQERKTGTKGNWPILSETDSLGYLEDVLKAVKFLHSKGIIHRDIKGNVKTNFSCCFTSVHRARKRS